MQTKKNKLNNFSLKFPSLGRNEGFARGIVSAFVLPLDPTVEELNDLKAAVSEAVTNAIVHAYPNEAGTIEMSGSATDSDAGYIIEIRVKDKGVGIADISQAMSPLYTSGGEDRAGLGFTVMESFTDKLRVRSVVGKGTVVTMTKTISGKQ
ncbi:MAG: anti-sigma F factor [Oscillospiraceae bacterium]|jgi:stage II sporulation protein AB (anti-sigma F factor)|nr:anti-sigma F factor [Oscillospiraceae bacterium]